MTHLLRPTLFLFLVSFAMLMSSETMAVAAPVTIYQEPFKVGAGVGEYTAGSLTGQNGWTSVISGGLNVNAVELIQGTGSDSASGNASLFTLSPSVKVVTIEATLRGRDISGFQNLLSIYDTTTSSTVIQIGVSYSSGSQRGFRIRRQDGSNFYWGQITGDDALSTTTHAQYVTRLTFDFFTQSGSLAVRRVLGDANFTTVANFTAADIGSLIGDQSNWTGFGMRLTAMADHFDNLLVNAEMAPEPSTFAMGMIGFAGLALARKRRMARA